MIEFVIFACIAGANVPQDTSCRNFPLVYDSQDVSMMLCMLRGQGEVARWQQSHPDWVILKWSCGAPGADKKAASGVAPEAPGLTAEKPI